MNEHVDFERLVAGHIAEEGATPPSDAFYDELFSRAGGSGQRPEWLALIKEPPMRTNNHLAVGSPTVRVMAILVATMLLALALAVAGAGAQQLLASNGPIVVAADGSGDFATIGEAVAAADDGDLVKVRPGTYVEAVVIDGDISLEGDGEREDVIIRAPDDGPEWDTKFPFIGDKPYAVVLAGSDASVSGLTLSVEDSRLCLDGGTATVTDMLFDEVGTPPASAGTAIARAIVVTGGADADIVDNEFVGGTGINVFEYSVARIEGNHFVVGGIYGDYGDGTTIRDNIFSEAAPMAIRFGEPADVLVEGNRIEDREVAINTINGLGPAVIRGNDIRGAEMTAISADSSTGQVIDNVIADSNLGISWSGDGGLVAGNTINGGATGIIVGAGTSTVRDNSVKGATNRGMSVYPSAVTGLSGNTLCGNAINLDVRDEAEVMDDGTNEVCEDAPAE